MNEHFKLTYAKISGLDIISQGGGSIDLFYVCRLLSVVNIVDEESLECLLLHPLSLSAYEL